MNLRDTPEEAAFRAELRTWLDDNLPEERRGWRGGEQRFGDEFGREWSRKLFDGGYSGLTWPTEYGGAGAPYSFQAIFYEEMARAQAPAARRRDRDRDGGADDHGPWHGGAEAGAPLEDPLRGGDLVPGLLRAGRGLRPRGRAHAHGAQGRRVRRQRPEGVVVVRAHRRLVHPHRPERSGGAALQGPQLHDRRHARARGRGAAAAPDHRRGGVQRDLLHRRRGARPRTCSPRRARAGRSR